MTRFGNCGGGGGPGIYVPLPSIPAAVEPCRFIGCIFVGVAALPLRAGL